MGSFSSTCIANTPVGERPAWGSAGRWRVGWGGYRVEKVILDQTWLRGPRQEGDRVVAAGVGAVRGPGGNDPMGTLSSRW